jgi:hypothetical protein
MLPQHLRIHDFNVRMGESPEDRLVQIAHVASLQGTNAIQTALRPGTPVIVVPYTVVTVDANGVATINLNPQQANGQPGGYLIFAPAYALQGGRAID